MACDAIDHAHKTMHEWTGENKVRATDIASYGAQKIVFGGGVGRSRNGLRFMIRPRHNDDQTCLRRAAFAQWRDNKFRGELFALRWLKLLGGLIEAIFLNFGQQRAQPLRLFRFVGRRDKSIERPAEELFKSTSKEGQGGFVAGDDLALQI